MKSYFQEMGEVNFPEFCGERIYMVPFRKSAPLPKSLTRWQSTVDMMTAHIDHDGPMYLMCDQGKVYAGQAHRRPGLHVDGNWIAEISDHYHPPTHFHPGYWKDGGGRWNDAYTPETILLASDVSACAGYSGEFNAPIGKGGEYSMTFSDSLERSVFKAHRCYAGNVTMLHESLPVPIDCLRTVVRINIPGHQLEQT